MTEIIIPIITGIVCLAVGVVIGFLYRKSVAEKAIGDAETEATRIINEAIKAGETKKRESVLEAKDEIHRQRVEADRELKERRNETQQLERRLIQREEALDKKSDTLDRKNEELSRHLESVQKKENELQRIKDEKEEAMADPYQAAFMKNRQNGGDGSGNPVTGQDGGAGDAQE